jgi:hypothetical protein
MIGININGYFLSLYPETRVEFQEENDFYTGGDPLFMRRPFSMPFKVSTKDNAHILGYSHRPESAHSFPYFTDCHIYAGHGLQLGAVLYSGTIYVTDSDEETTELFFTAAIPEISEETFGEFDIGGFEITTIANPDFQEEAIEHANDTVANPFDYPHAVFPVENDGFKADNIKPFRADTDYSHMQNYWFVPSQSFIPTAIINDRFVTWFLRVDFLIDKIGELLNLKVENLIQTADEFKLLYLYSNYHAHIDTIALDPDDIPFLQSRKWDPFINYNKMIPSTMKIVEFLKIFARRFCSGIFIDDVEKRIWMIPYREILLMPYEFDFTEQLVSTPRVNSKNDIPGTYEFDIDKSDSVFTNNTYVDITALGYGEPTDHLDEGFPDSDGFWYMVHTNTYYYRAGGELVWSGRFFERMNTANIKGQPQKLKGAPLFQSIYSPYCRIPGNQNGTGYALEEIRLMLYRGMKTINGKYVPYASNNAYDPDTFSEAYNYSLIMNGEKGCYEVWFKEWIYLLENLKTVTLSFRLTVGDLVKLKPWSKIRAGENFYLIKSRKVTFSMEGMSNVEMQLIRVN